MEPAGRIGWTGRRVAGSAAACAAAAQLAACATAPQPGWREVQPPRYPGSPARSRSYARAGAAPSRGEDGLARPRAYNRPYVVHGREYAPAADPGYDETGIASWYGYESGHRTSDGEVFTLDGLTAAHRTLPIPSLLEVTNLATGAQVVVRLNDRGPFVEGRLIDLSHEAARRLGVLGAGSARVRVRYLGPADPGAPVMLADAPRGRHDTRLAPPRAAPRDAPSEAAPLDPLELVSDLPDVTAAGPGRRGADGAIVQAAAFADPERAAAAAERLAQAGLCRVEPLARDGTGPLYRVVLRGDAGEGARLREAAAALGFPDARVVSD